MNDSGPARRVPHALVTRRRVLAGLGGLMAAGSVATFVGPAGRNPVSVRSAGADAAGPGVVPAGFVEFHDSRVGFGLAYPQEWIPVENPDPQVVLLVAQQERYCMQVRVIELRNPIAEAQLPAAQAVTDRIVAANPTVRLLEGPRAISLGGLPGLFYFYTFADPGTGQLGVHSHFFVFRAGEMIALLFQAVPAAAFHTESAVFDRVTGSFYTV